MVGYKTIMIIFLSLYVKSLGGRIANRTPSIGSYFFQIMAGLTVTFLLIVAWVNFTAYKAWKQADIQYRYFGNTTAAAQLLGADVGVLSTDGKFLMYYGRVLFLDGQYGKAVSVMERARRYISDPLVFYTLGQSYSLSGRKEQSEKNFKTSVNIIPNNLYPRYLLFQHLVRFRDFQKASVTAKKIINIQAKVMSPAVQDMKNEAEKYLGQHTGGL
jgi:tetratricopeptide (TPR) repeat protein